MLEEPPQSQASSRWRRRSWGYAAIWMAEAAENKIVNKRRRSRIRNRHYECHLERHHRQSDAYPSEDTQLDKEAAVADNKTATARGDARVADDIQRAPSSSDWCKWHWWYSVTRRGRSSQNQQTSQELAARKANNIAWRNTQQAEDTSCNNELANSSEAKKANESCEAMSRNSKRDAADIAIYLSICSKVNKTNYSPTK